MPYLIPTSYSARGTLWRLLLDIAVANFGMLLGTLVSILLNVIRFPSVSQDYLVDMLAGKWLHSIPLVSLVCATAFPLAGIYAIDLRGPYPATTLPLVRGWGGALALHVGIVFLLDIMVPRSMMVAGWIWIGALLLGGRLGRSWFVKTFRLLPLDSRQVQLERLESTLAVARQTFDWLPPEAPQAKAPWPHFDQEDILAAANVLRSGKVNQWTGQEVTSFQDEFRDFCGTRHCVALTNGTVALDLAFHALGLQPGDEVVVTPRTFIASASSAVLAGLRPVFADVDRDSQNITAATVARVLTPKTKAIIAVHLAGWPCDMDSLRELARERHLALIEDCAQAHGAQYRNRPVGSFGTMAAFSFCQDKIMTTGGEGGALLTDEEQLWRRAWSFKDHGKSFDKVFAKNPPTGFRWLHDTFGTNWRMTEIQAAIGRVQLRKLNDWVEIRRRNAAILHQRFAALPALRLTTPPPEIRHAYYKYYAFVRPEALKTDWTRDRILAALLEAGVAVFSGSCSEIYLEEAFGAAGLRPAERLPVARELGETSLMFLVHPTLTPEHMHATADAVVQVVTQATR